MNLNHVPWSPSMVKVDKLVGISTAAIIATLLFMLLLISQQPSAGSLFSNDHATSGFMLESVFSPSEAEPRDTATPDAEQTDFIKPSARQLPGALSHQPVFELILTISDSQSPFANIRAPPSLS